MNNDKVLRVGIVGFGGGGQGHFTYFKQLPGCDVVSVFNPADAGMERARQACPSLLVTDDFERFLNSGIDIVSVCSPDRTHADYMVRALAAGKHALCEKPLTDSLEGCQRILQAERDAPQCVAAVQHQMRFIPMYRKMRDIIKRGELGTVHYIEGYYVHDLRQRASVFHDWRFQDNATPLVYAGCHFIDLLRWLLDDEVEEVVGMASNLAYPAYPESDLNVVLLRFRSGVIGKVVVAFGAARPQDHSLRVYGTAKSLENNLLFSGDGTFEVIARPYLSAGRRPAWGRRHLLRQMRMNFQPWLIGRVFEWLTRRRSGSANYAVQAYPVRLYEHSDGCIASIADFVNAIRARRRPACTVLDAAKTVATCLAGVEAYRSRSRVDCTQYLSVLERTSEASLVASRP